MSTLTQATQRLREEGIDFKIIMGTGGKRLLIEPTGRRLMFWPPSGKFYPRRKGNPKPTSHLNGVEDLINYLKGE